MIIGLPGDYEVTMLPFLSGAELLSNQTFVDLFADETIVDGEGLAVRLLALLFTDLKASTELYDRIGDLKAFDLVRMHFDYLRESIAANSGALVKTIGDAVMASFVDPLDGLRAALDMQARIARLNADAGGELIRLKVGLHAGACLAVTLNDRLDYFGQTVNIAARVQSLAGADEIVVTDDVLSLPGAAELVCGLQVDRSAVELKGIAGDVAVHRVHAPVGSLSGAAGTTRHPAPVCLSSRPGTSNSRAHQRAGREPGDRDRGERIGPARRLADRRQARGGRRAAGQSQDLDPAAHVEQVDQVAAPGDVPRQRARVRGRIGARHVVVAHLAQVAGVRMRRSGAAPARTTRRRPSTPTPRSSARSTTGSERSSWPRPGSGGRRSARSSGTAAPASSWSRAHRRASR